MKENIIIKQASMKDWRAFKKIRLDALMNNPESFGSSYEEEANKEDKKWKEKFKDTNRIVFIAFNHKLPIGVALVSYESAERFKHLAHMYSVYIKKEFRGKGISNLLIKSIMLSIKRRKNIKKIKLNVVKQQIQAINLYKKFGFKIIGELKKEMKIKNKYYDEYLMERLL